MKIYRNTIIKIISLPEYDSFLSVIKVNTVKFERFAKAIVLFCMRIYYIFLDKCIIFDPTRIHIIIIDVISKVAATAAKNLTL